MDVETMLGMRKARTRHHSAWSQYGEAAYWHNHPNMPAIAQAMRDAMERQANGR